MFRGRVSLSLSPSRALTHSFTLQLLFNKSICCPPFLPLPRAYHEIYVVGATSNRARWESSAARIHLLAARRNTPRCAIFFTSEHDEKPYTSEFVFSCIFIHQFFPFPRPHFHTRRAGKMSWRLRARAWVLLIRNERSVGLCTCAAFFADTIKYLYEEVEECGRPMASISALVWWVYVFQRKVFKMTLLNVLITLKTLFHLSYKLVILNFETGLVFNYNNLINE